MKKDRSSEKINKHIQNAQLHLKEKQAPLLLNDIRSLKTYTIYSDVHRDAYTKHEELEPKIIRFLFKSLSLEQFIALADEDLFYSSQIYEALDPISVSVSVDQLLFLVQKLQFPSKVYAKRLFRKLIDDPHESTTRKLEEYVGQRCAKEAEEGTTFSRHQKTMSSFHYLRWMPDDQGLSDAIAIVALRRDSLAKELKKKYLLTLPWGTDRSATTALLESLDEDRSEENRILIKQALNKYKTPSQLRLMLAGAYGEYDPYDALSMSIEDLNRVQSEDGRFSYLDWFWTALQQLERQKNPMNVHRLENSLNSLSTNNWSILSRGYLGVILAKKFPDTSPTKVSGFLERSAVRLIRLFQIARLDHMGFFLSLPVLFGVGYLFLWLLNFLLEKPVKPNSLIDDLALSVWIISAGITSRTHFSGHESMRECFWMALLFWGTPLLFVIVSVAIRV